MLPAELLLQVCGYLTPTDIIALSETNTANKTTLGHLRKLFLKYPWFDQNYSQWKNSPLSVCHELEPVQTRFKNVLPPDAFHDEPLPPDFQALRGDCRRDENYSWNVCDEGLYFNTLPDSDDEWEVENTNGILDLREEEDEDDLPATPYPSKKVTGLNLRKHLGCCPWAEVKSDKVAAIMLETFDGAQKLVVKHGSNEQQEYDLEKPKGIYLVGEMVIVTRHNLKPQYVIPGSRHLATIEHALPSPADHQGFMMYNGNLFQAVLDEHDQLVVGTLDLKIDRGDRTSTYFLYTIHQDDRNPRYALACTKTGITVYLIDLHLCTVTILLDRNDLWIPGLSEGKLEIWKYSPQYLYAVARILGKNILGEMVDIYMVRGVDAFFEEHRRVWMGWQVDSDKSSKCVVL